MAARRKLRANATRVKAVSGVCSAFGVQNLNPQQEEAAAEFLSGMQCIRKLAYGIWEVPSNHMAPLVSGD